MLKRKATDEMKRWLKGKHRKCLMVQGARQVGKTYVIERFGEENFEETLEINFKETSSAKEIFSGDLDVATMLRAMRFRYPEKRIIPGKTLIFLDEIQECPEAITSLKFFATDDGFDVIASGSLLGIDYNRPSSYPVGYVDYLQMHGLDFEEFLWARGISEELIDGFKAYLGGEKAIPPSINGRMMQLYREYVALGGMPEVIDAYLQSGLDFREADRIQKNLLNDYLFDIAHYARAEEKIKAEKCFLSLSRQLLDKENHKFQYKEVEEGGRAQKYYSSVDWLQKADIVFLSRHVKKAAYDLEDYIEGTSFRAYPSDLSLLMGMRDFSLKQRIVENSLSGNTKGGVYECAVADALSKQGCTLYYYRNETRKKEVEFLIEKDGMILPIEVKGGNNRATSLKWLLKDSQDIVKAYKFIDGNAGVSEEGIITLPLYMAAFI